MRGCI